MGRARPRMYVTDIYRLSWTLEQVDETYRHLCKRLDRSFSFGDRDGEYCQKTGSKLDPSGLEQYTTRKVVLHSNNHFMYHCAYEDNFLKLGIFIDSQCLGPCSLRAFIHFRCEKNSYYSVFGHLVCNSFAPEGV